MLFKYTGGRYPVISKAFVIINYNILTPRFQPLYCKYGLFDIRALSEEGAYGKKADAWIIPSYGSELR